MLETKNQALGGFVIIENGPSAIEGGRSHIAPCAHRIFTGVDLKWKPTARTDCTLNKRDLAPAFAAQRIRLTDTLPTRDAERWKKEIKPLPAPNGRASSRNMPPT